MVDDPRPEFLACTTAARELRSRSAEARRALERTRATSRNIVSRSKLAKAKMRATVSQLSRRGAPAAAPASRDKRFAGDFVIRKNGGHTGDRFYWADVRQQARDMAEHAREMRSTNSALQERMQELQFEINSRRLTAG